MKGQILLWAPFAQIPFVTLNGAVWISVSMEFGPEFSSWFMASIWLLLAKESPAWAQFSNNTIIQKAQLWPQPCLIPGMMTQLCPSCVTSPCLLSSQALPVCSSQTLPSVNPQKQGWWTSDKSLAVASSTATGTASGKHSSPRVKCLQLKRRSWEINWLSPSSA